MSEIIWAGIKWFYAETTTWIQLVHSCSTLSIYTFAASVAYSVHNTRLALMFPHWLIKMAIILFNRFHDAFVTNWLGKRSKPFNLKWYSKTIRWMKACSNGWMSWHRKFKIKPNQKIIIQKSLMTSFLPNG